jgi:hypothetical protein
VLWMDWYIDDMAVGKGVNDMVERRFMSHEIRRRGSTFVIDPNRIAIYIRLLVALHKRKGTVCKRIRPKSALIA